jgi:hypothetical protein
MLCLSRRRLRRPPDVPAGRPLRAIVPLLVLSLLVAGCSEDDEEPPASSPSPSAESSSTAPEKPPLRTSTEVGEVVGKLPRAERQAAAQQVSRIVDRWWRAAYLGEDLPRGRRVQQAFPAFTRGVTAQARADRALLTNAGLGGWVDEVTATRRRVTVDLLATDGRARTATARLGLDFRVSGGQREPQRVAVRGRLVLTKVDGRWRVFGYDVTRGPAAGEQGGGQASKKQDAKKQDGKKQGGGAERSSGKQSDTSDRQRGRRSGKGNR